MNKISKKSGKIVSYFSDVAKIRGLKGVFLDELLVDKKEKPIAIVIGFNEEFTEALFFDEAFDIEEPVFVSGKFFSVPVSDTIMGRVLNGLGQPLDNLGKPSGEKRSVFSIAPQIIEREPVKVPLSTGVKIIDSVLTLGRGQRELIVGDRKVGKSTLALDVVLNQKMAEPPLYCIYVVCGQKEQKLNSIISLFEQHNAFLHTTIVAGRAEDSFASQYLAPFVGCTIAEYFRDQGKDALVVYDDLTKHAKTYRSVALLLERAPGRESYPGDIFSLHAGLLERAANVSNKGGSLSALPIIETQEGDITSFIATNLISITDGQIYLERGLFQKGFLPAVNVGLSVSRVGSQAQPASLKQVVGGLRLALSQHRQLQKLNQLETTLSEQAKQKIHRGQLTLELLKQERHTNITWPEQVVLFYAMENGFFDKVEKEQWGNFEKILLELLRSRYNRLLKKIHLGKLTKEIEREIREIILEANKEFLLN